MTIQYLWKLILFAPCQDMSVHEPPKYVKQWPLGLLLKVLMLHTCGVQVKLSIDTKIHGLAASDSTCKACDIMSFWAVFKGLGSLFYVLLGPGKVVN